MRWVFGDVPGTRPKRWLLAPLIALVFMTPLALATTGRAPASKFESHWVELRVSGDEAAVTLMRATALELFARLGVRTQVVGPNQALPERSSAPLAIATIQLAPTNASIVVTDGTSGRELDSRSFSGTASVETSVEATAHVAYFVVETLLGPAMPDATPSEPTAESLKAGSAPSAPQKAPPRSRDTQADAPNEPSTLSEAGMPSTLGFDLGIAASATTLGTDRLLPGAGLTGELHVRTRRLRYGSWLSVTTHSATNLNFSNASAELRSSHVRLLGTLDVPLSSRTELFLGAGPALEWLRLVPVEQPAHVRVSAARSLFKTLLSVATGVRLALGERSFVSALLGIDVSLTKSRFWAHQADQQTQLLATPTWRPMLLLTASTSLAGSARFSAAERAR